MIDDLPSMLKRLESDLRRDNQPRTEWLAQDWLAEYEEEQAGKKYRDAITDQSHRETPFKDATGKIIHEGDVVICIDKYQHEIASFPDVVIETKQGFDLASNSDSDANYLEQFTTLDNYDVYIVGVVFDEFSSFGLERRFMFYLATRINKILKGGR